MNNFLTRTLTGIVYLAVMIFGIIWDRAIFTALFLLVMVVSLREFYSITLGSLFKVQQKTATAAAVIAFVALCCHRFFGTDLSYIAAAVPVMLLIPVTTLFSNREQLPDLGLVFAGLVYILLPFSVYPFIVTDGEVFDGTILLSMFIIIWVSDVGAYCFGTLFGQGENSARLAPSISPKKSWIGFWSGVAFGIAASVGLYFLTWLPFSIWHCVALGAVISVGGVCGDLFESVWKRHYHVKDSGNCIPGHGGMLDRFDSSLIAIPLASAYMILFGLI